MNGRVAQPGKAAPATRRMGAAGLKLLRFSGWFTLLVMVCMIVVDLSGIVKHEIQNELQRRLDPLGHTIELGKVEIDWLGPGVELVDLRVIGAGREHVRIERLHVAAGFSTEHGLHLTRMDLDGGRVVISERAIEGLRALSVPDAAVKPRSFAALELPPAQVRDLKIDFELPDGPVLPLGSLDISMRVEGDIPSRITGRFVLPSKPSATGNTEVYVTGLLGRDGRLELHTITDALDLDAWDLPDVAPFDQFEALSPTGRLSVHTTGSVMLVGDLEPKGDLRVRMEQGSLHAPGIEPALQDLALELEARFAPAANEDFWVSGAWEGGGLLSASWSGQDLRGGLRLGRSARPGLALETWVHGPKFDIDDPAIHALDGPEPLPNIRDALNARGLLDVSFGLTCSDEIRPGVNPWPQLEIAVFAEETSLLRAAFEGYWDPDAPDIRPLAFPLPMEVDAFRLAFGHQKRFPRQDLMEARFAARHSTGPATGSFQMWSTPIDMPPFAPGFGESEYDLFVAIPHIKITEEINQHLPGLWEIPEAVTIFSDYGVTENGSAELMLRVSSRADLPSDAVRADLIVTGAALAWSELPVPVSEVDATIRILDDGRGPACVSFTVDGRLADARGLHVAGRVRTELDPPTAEESRTIFDLTQVKVDSIAIPSGDIDVLGAAVPETGEALDLLAPRGRLDIDYTRTARAENDPVSWVELSIEPGPFSLEYREFPLRMEDVRGRVVLEFSEDLDAQETGLESQEVAVRASPLLAQLDDRLPISADIEINSHAPSRGRVLGAGVRPADRDLILRIARVLDTDPEELLASLDDISIAGAIDFDYHFDLEGDVLDDAVRFRLRDIICRQEGGFEVDRIDGALELREERLSGEHLSAFLGDTAVDLSSVELRLEADSVMVDADVHAENVSIDAQLLRQFLEPEMVTSLIEEFGLRGTVDLQHGHVSLELGSDQEPLVVFSGQGTATDAHIAIGLPLVVRSAQLDLERLVIQGDDVRGWGRVHDLYGQALGRDLSKTDLLLSYYGSQINIESVDGQFCRGRISGLSGSQLQGGGGPVLSVDLYPPYRFQAGVALSNIEIRLLLDDVFASEIADKGFLTGQLSLQGEFENLLDVRGAGWGRVDETVLWSVPVVRSLFSQLGLDETAIFDEMKSEFHIENGAIHMEEMRVHSPLLNLEGAGRLGLDGTLAHDLEVRYSLIDKAGPFSSLIYWLQNRLLSISVRGDMSRPKIILRGVFSNPFFSSEGTWRALPAPGFSPLRNRF